MHAKVQALLGRAVPGDKAPGSRRSTSVFVQLDENGEIELDQSIAQVTPLPKGASGNIDVTE